MQALFAGTLLTVEGDKGVLSSRQDWKVRSLRRLQNGACSMKQGRQARKLHRHELADRLAPW